MFPSTITAKKIVLVVALLATAVTVTTTAAWANAPGGAYIQCDPRNPQSPVRCRPDSW
jgi:hypothetical protein